jgi:hypothetical protein
MSLVFFPAPTSDITLSQSTFFPAVAQALVGLKPTPNAPTRDSPAIPSASFRITAYAPLQSNWISPPALSQKQSGAKSSQFGF